MECVLDASLALAWVLPDESAGAADRLWTGPGGRSVLWVPALWWYEVANALTVARRQRRLTPADALRAFEL